MDVVGYLRPRSFHLCASIGCLVAAACGGGSFEELVCATDLRIQARHSQAFVSATLHHRRTFPPLDHTAGFTLDWHWRGHDLRRVKVMASSCCCCC